MFTMRVPTEAEYSKWRDGANEYHRGPDARIGDLADGKIVWVDRNPEMPEEWYVAVVYQSRRTWAECKASGQACIVELILGGTKAQCKTLAMLLGVMGPPVFMVGSEMC